VPCGLAVSAHRPDPGFDLSGIISGSFSLSRYRTSALASRVSARAGICKTVPRAAFRVFRVFRGFHPPGSSAAVPAAFSLSRTRVVHRSYTGPKLKNLGKHGRNTPDTPSTAPPRGRESRFGVHPLARSFHPLTSTSFQPLSASFRLFQAISGYFNVNVGRGFFSSSVFSLLSRTVIRRLSYRLLTPTNVS
jgi:hypothetical protein